MALLQVRLTKLENAEFTRSAGLLGTTKSHLVQRAVRAAIRKARRLHPKAFNLLTDDEQLIYEAIEGQQVESEQILEYTGMNPRKMQRILDDLVERGILGANDRRMTAHGAAQKIYRIIKKITADGEIR